jgi:hypothetical protein
MAVMMQRLGMEKGEAIEHKMVNRAIENAQKKVEEMNYTARKGTPPFLLPPLCFFCNFCCGAAVPSSHISPPTKIPAPRPAILVAIVTAPIAPALAIICASRKNGGDDATIGYGKRRGN